MQIMKNSVSIQQLKAGMTVRIQKGFTCMEPGLKVVEKDGDGSLYVTCSDGKHFLDGQVIDTKGTLVGIKPK